MTIMAKPIAASAAATVKINIVNIWPNKSPEKIEKEIMAEITTIEEEKNWENKFPILFPK